MSSIWEPLPGKPAAPELLLRGDGSPGAIRAGISTGMWVASIACLVFTVLGIPFFPLPLAAWPGGLLLGYLSGRGIPRWLSILCGGAIPVLNTILSILVCMPFIAIFGDDGDMTRHGIVGPAVFGLILFSPLLLPLGLIAGWFIDRAVRKEMAKRLQQ